MGVGLLRSVMRTPRSTRSPLQQFDYGTSTSIQLRGGVRYNGSKVPTVRLEFPQALQARDEKCNVNWATNSAEFYVEFESNEPTQVVHHLRRFRYDLAADVFSLSTAPERR